MASALAQSFGQIARTIRQEKKIISKIPLNKIGHPNDIAEAVIFLAKSNYITGQTLNVDGGRSISI